MTTGQPRQTARIHTGAVIAGAVLLSAAVGVLGPSGSFALTFLYTACTLGVCAAATAATIHVLAQLMRGGSGVVEIGLLIGLFVVSPLALSGAFQLLQATLGSP